MSPKRSPASRRRPPQLRRHARRGLQEAESRIARAQRDARPQGRGSRRAARSASSRRCGSPRSPKASAPSKASRRRASQLEEKLKDAASGSERELARSRRARWSPTSAAPSPRGPSSFAATADEMRRAAQDMQRELTPDPRRAAARRARHAGRGARGEHRHAQGGHRADRRDQRAVEDRRRAMPASRSMPTDTADPRRAQRRAVEDLRPVARPPQPTRRPELREPDPAPARRRSFGRPAGAAPAAGPKPAPSLPPAQPLETASGKGGNGQSRGWVADLLRRASSHRGRQRRPTRSRNREPPVHGKRSPAQVVESLNSLSIDIARAIDHEASVELWDRYKRGERNVFTRRLYTLQGQRTFDELRRKYERDQDFRQAVDNYINDFERLLSQVSRGRRRSVDEPDVPDLGHRQGLHHAGPRGGTAELAELERRGSGRLPSESASARTPSGRFRGMLRPSPRPAQQRRPHFRSKRRERRCAPPASE